jgi:outer membrane protein, heavy metal efflux system
MKNACALIFILLLVISSAPFPCRAETMDLPQAVTINQLLEILREKSPRFAAERASIDIAASEVVAARVLPNPSINYGRYDNLAGNTAAQFNGSQLQQSTVDIPLLIAGQRAIRSEAAARGVSAAKARVQARYAELARQAWQFFVKLTGWQERVRVLEDARSHLERLKGIVSGRESAGTASKYEMMRITVEAAALDARLADARAEVSNSAGEISTLLGLPGWRPRAVGAFTPLGVKVDLGVLWDKAQQLNPSLEAVRRDGLAADAAIKRVKRERWPVPVVSLGSAWTNNPDSNTLVTGLSVTIPLFDRNQGPIARALAEKRSVMLSLQSLTAETRAELERAAVLLIQKRENLGRFEADAMSQLPSLEQMAESAYRLGKSSLLELLDATRSRTELKINQLDLIEAVIEAEIDTLAAAGLLLGKAVLQ